MARETAGLSGWGRTFVSGRERCSENLLEITAGSSLSRGLGRSYGDASLPAPGVFEVSGTRLADRILSFDEATCVLRAEAGFSLEELLKLYLPRGFFTPVTPGTKFVTLGGMVASDVHGKNHHIEGTIGRHVQALKLRLSDGRVVRCSREMEPELFRATLGGMGLTGHILEVDLKLVRVPTPWIYQESFRFSNLDAFLPAIREASNVWPFTVAWMDTAARGTSLGRGILFCGRWAEPAEAPAHFPKEKPRITLPFALPSGLINRATMRAFNTLVYRSHLKQHAQKVVDAASFFYPLDFMLRWNLAYGARGVTQHQCVIPDEAGTEGVRGLLSVLSESGACSFLTVVKDCGPEGEGLLSFPRSGMSVALDIPIRDNTQGVVDRLNEHVIRCGGRIYLTKDGFTRPAHFSAMEPRLQAFLAQKRIWDPQGKIRSAQSMRLFGEQK